MANFNTMNFLPEIFRTLPNKKFIHATLDQLMADPTFSKVSGYIGREFSPTFKSSDSYIKEISQNRQNYQLESGVVNYDSNGDVIFYANYIDLLNQIQNLGGITNNQSRLFESENYTYDPLIDYDKLINYQNYYWMPLGYTSAPLSVNDIPTQLTYTVTRNEQTKSFQFDITGIQNNPTITLVRGGTYSFVNNGNSRFWIQSDRNVNGLVDNLQNISSRDVFGVNNNGAENGIITFDVPLYETQSYFTNMPMLNPINIGLNSSFSDISGKTIGELGSIFDGINVEYLNGKSVVFLNAGMSDSFWTDINGKMIPSQFRLYSFVINLNPPVINGVTDFSNINDTVVQFTLGDKINVSNRFLVSEGVRNGNIEWYLNDALVYVRVPALTSQLDELYYSDGSSDNFTGVIKLVDKNNVIINVETDIIGKEGYISPSGVSLTNGMLVSFNGSVYPSKYSSDMYFVEGVGSSIDLVPFSNLVTPELDYTNAGVPFDSEPFDILGFDQKLNYPTVPDYITIKRNSVDGNPWSRSNRWVHVDVLRQVSTINNVPFVLDSSMNAKRPIIEFEKNIKLYNYGLNYVPNLNFFDFTVTDALTQIEGSVGFPLTQTNVNTIISSKFYQIQVNALDANLNPILYNYNLQNGDKLRFDKTCYPQNYAGKTFLVSNIGVGNIVLTEVVDFYYDLQVASGMTVVFANDNDPTVRNKIFTVNLVKANRQLNSGSSLVVLSLTFISLDEVYSFNQYDSVVPKNAIIVPLLPYNSSNLLDLENPTLRSVQSKFSTNNNTYYVYVGNNPLLGVIAYDYGVVIGINYWFDGNKWNISQTKNTVNQPPLFDMIDKNGKMLSDATTYQATSFIGTKLFSYVTGSGLPDSILGFPLSYNALNNIGDIEFYNNIDVDTFTYISGETKLPVTEVINVGFVPIISSNNTLLPKNIWNKTVENTKQYQEFNIIYNGLSNYFTIDIYPDKDNYYSNLKVYVNFNLINGNDYELVTLNNNSVIAVKLNVTLNLNDLVTILVYNSELISNYAFYQTPSNLDFNPLNKTFSTLTVGQIRNHLIFSANESKNIIGTVPGESNLRDVDVSSFEGTIQQQSASLVYPYEFLLNPQLDFIKSLEFAEREYSKFKNKLLEQYQFIVDAGITDPVAALDFAMQQINYAKNNSMPWYYSDMLPYGSNKTVINYTVENTTTSQYQLSSIFNINELSNNAIIVYKNNVQLVYGRDYYFSNQYPEIVMVIGLNLNDKITIVYYNDTDGCYIPETPTKMGLYPKFIPEIFTDMSYGQPLQMIRGHDGSITLAFGDFRDEILLEFELRVYNNIKVNYSSLNININDYLPGYFRNTDYSISEFTNILSSSFYKWLGNNKVPFGNNEWFNGNNTWTWNYSSFVDKNNQPMPGFWRGIYNYYFDTETPHLTPWVMLGFETMPDWWESVYGPAPYTGGNQILWGDLENGYIRGGSNAGTFLSSYSRIGLSKFIPVDSSGNLLSPDVCIAGYVNSKQANNPFVFGDQSPVESAWRKSSSYPYAIQRALALMKPAKYFSLFLNVNNYYYNYNLGQYLVNSTNARLTPFDLMINGSNLNGNTIRAAGYLNWVSDYIRYITSADPTLVIGNFFNTYLTTKLNYKMGGFTDKSYLQVIAEQLSVANQTNSEIVNSVSLPAENYNILLHKSSPISTFVYSAVVVEKTSTGFIVNGYDVANPVFTIIPSNKVGTSYDISVGDSSAVVYNQGENYSSTVLYGTMFYNIADVCDFLISYSRYLTFAGFTFENSNSDLQQVIDFTTSVKELLTWYNQNWVVGSAISLSPVTNSITFNYQGLPWCVDQITNDPDGSKILDMNQTVIKIGNFSVDRTDTDFTVATLDGRSIGLLSIDLVQYEHCCIFDNETVFNDVIYQPELGSRQYRLKLIGNMVDNWNGQMSPSGFVYANSNVNQWQQNTDYKVGDIVQYKGINYSALVDISGTTTFVLNENWVKLSTTELQTGLLPNFAFNASQFLDFYDVDTQSYDQLKDQFSMGLIGFRQRQYLTDIGVTPTSQIKFYQGYITQKGTMNSVNAMINADFGNMSGNVSVYEEWAFRVGSYGGTDSTQYFEVCLDQSVFTQDPIVFTLLNDGQSLASNLTAGGTVIGLTSSDLYEIPKTFTSTPIANRSDDSNYNNDLMTAGYVNLADIDYTIYDITNYQEFNNIMYQIQDGNKIWIAKDFNLDWSVRRVELTLTTVVSMQYQLDGTALITFSSPHYLTVQDIFVVTGFNSAIDGVMVVNSVVDEYNLIVSLTDNQTTVLSANPFITTYGTVNQVMRLVTVRYSTFDQLGEYNPIYGWKTTDRVWVDYDPLNWSVYYYEPPFSSFDTVTSANVILGNDVIFGNTVVADMFNGNTLSANAYGLSLGSIVASDYTGTYDFIYFNYNSATVNANAIGFVDNSKLSAINLYNQEIKNILTTANTIIYASNDLVLINEFTFGGAYSTVETILQTDPANASAKINTFSSTDTNFAKFSAASSNSTVFYSVSDRYVYQYFYNTNLTYGNIITNRNMIPLTSLVSNSATISGFSINSSGNLFAIGSSVENKVYLFDLNGNIKQTFVSNSAVNSSQFGYYVSFDGNDNLIITEPFALQPNISITGNVYIYSSENYELIQTLKSPASEYVYNESNGYLDIESFGIKIKTFSNIMAISSSHANIFETMVFDSGNTTFDNKTTGFYNKSVNYGVVYLFSLLPSGKYIHMQTLTSDNDPNFGYDFSLSKGKCIVSNGSNKIYYFNNLNNYDTSWQLLRSYTEKTDVDVIYKSFLYNNSTETLINSFDVYDPVKGKLLGPALQELNFITELDPAIYTSSSLGLNVNQNISWTDEHVGKLWLDCSKLRFIDYEQDSLLYRINNWGALFPKSTVNVLEWVKSVNPPEFYNGSGSVYYSDFSTFSLKVVTDPITGKQTVYYYFWVINKTTVEQQWRRTTAVSVANMILNPLQQNIPMLSCIRNDTIMLSNTQPELSTNTSILHFEYKLSNNPQIIHNEYQLVQRGNPNSMLPTRIVKKLIDSLVGEDSAGNVLPDSTLKPSQKYGISIRPRQTMFVNRLAAVKNLVQFVNNKLGQYPIAVEANLEYFYTQQQLPTNFDYFGINLTVSTYDELFYIDISTLHAPIKFPNQQPIYQSILVLNDINVNGRWSIYSYIGGSNFQLSSNQSYKTPDYWSFVDWYDSSYDSSTEVTYTVNNFSEIGYLNLVSGDTVKVLNSGAFEIYKVNTDMTKTLVGVKNGTIVLSDSLWDYAASGIGYDNNNFDITGYAKQPVIELRNIIIGLQTSLFVNSLAGSFNDLVFLLLDYILSEQKMIDWAFKTSFISVKQQLRNLAQYPTYSEDNHSFYEDYINEVKPYRTVIRQQTISYSGLDVSNVHMTDFDLPSYYDTTYGWRSPSGELASDAAILSNNSVYLDWVSNHALTIENVLIENAGENYSYPPTLQVIGGNGTGGNLSTSINSTTYSINKVTVNNGGQYLSTPNISVFGDGTTITTIGNVEYFSSNYGTNQTFRAYPVMKNNLVRNINMTLKFDRITYNPTVYTWTEGTSYTFGQKVVINNNIYNVIVSDTTKSYFDPVEYSLVTEANIGNYMDRIVAYYKPSEGMLSSNVALLTTGVQYPGIPVTGVDYRVYKNLPIDTLIGNGAYTNTTLNNAIQNVNVQSNQYIDYWISHGPEEFIPGIMYDNLSIKVFTVATSGTSPRPSVNVPNNTIGVDGQFLNLIDEYQPYGFRIVKNLYNETQRIDGWSFYSISMNNVSALVANLSITDSLIYVKNANAFAFPKTGSFAQVYINGELIEYSIVDTVNNTLGGLRRGTWGTGTPQIHLVGSVAEGISFMTQLPNTNQSGNPYDPNNNWNYDIYNNTAIIPSFIRKAYSYLPWGNNY